MPGRSDDVRCSGRTGSSRYPAKVSRLTHFGSRRPRKILRPTGPSPSSSCLVCPVKLRMLRTVCQGEAHMARMFVDCRDYPSEMNCTVAISADTKNELLEAAVQHAVAVHGHHDSSELRQELAKMIKTE